MITTSVRELYIHGSRPSRREDTAPTPMLFMPQVDLVQGQGIHQDRRYFRPEPEGRVRKRQVSLIDEGTIWRLEQQFGPIERAFIKAQVVLAGEFHLPDMVGSVLRFSVGVELEIAVAREPCYAMDFIYPGLKAAMEGGMQGALARVISSGRVSVGDSVEVVEALSRARALL